jgi:hypothetical protein
MDRANRHDEANPVGGRDVTATPCVREGDLVLSGDQRRVGTGQRFGADIILPDPAQSRAAQRGRVQPNQRLEAGVAGFRQQHGTEAGRNVTRACAALAGVGEPAGEAGARMHLQQQLRQVHSGQPRRDRRLERDQARRLLQLIERGEDQFAIFNRYPSNFRQFRGRILIGGVDLSGEARDLGRRIV